MDDATGVRELERLQQLRRDGDELAEFEPRLAIQVFAEPGAVDVFHRDERDFVVLAVFIDADDVRMMKPARRACLVLEPPHELLGQIRIHQVLAHRLDRDDALDVRIEGFVDDTHCALAEDALDFVFAESERFSHRDFRAIDYLPSSMFIACTTLVFIRPSASVSTPISSLLRERNSPASMLPRLTWSAIFDSRVTRLTTIE